MVRRVVLLVAAVVLATVAQGFAPASAQYVPGQPGFTIDPGSVPDTGGPVTITGVGCPPDSTATAYMIVNGQEIEIGSGQVSSDPDGGFQFGATIPPTPAGDYTVLVRCGDITLSNVITVTPTGTAVTGPLPRTGSDTMGMVRIGLGLVAVGGLLVLAERKRRRRAVA